MSHTFLRTRDTRMKLNKKSNCYPSSQRREKIKDDSSKYVVGNIKIRTIEKIKQNKVVRTDREGKLLFYIILSRKSLIN